MTEIICRSCEKVFILEDINDKVLRKQCEEQIQCPNCIHKQEMRYERNLE